ncbi:MAG: hypothetical protein MJK07_04915 [Flavobacteriales bacterium]|nr:hypothetical protein [Flavobacteriales bacterium]
MNSKVLMKNAHFGSLAFDTCHASFDNQAHQVSLFLVQLFSSQVCFLSVFIRKVAAKVDGILVDLLDRKTAVYVAVVLKLIFEIANC